MNKIKKSLMVAAGSLVSGFYAALSAQTNIGTKVITEVSKEGRNVITSLVELMQVLIVIAGIGTLATVVFKVVKGDREAAEKIAWWLGGLIIGFVLLQVVQTLI